MCSVLGQQHGEIEYIVVDPGSTDGSREILKEHDGVVSKLILERDEGPADGLNTGLREATGEIFGYLNADDAYLPDAIARAVTAFRNTAADVVYGNGFVVDEHGRVQRRFLSAPFDLDHHICGTAPIMQQSTFFRRSALLEVGGFNTTNSTCWDSEILVDLALAKKAFARRRQYWSLFTIHPNSISGSGRLNTLYATDRARIYKKATMRDPVRNTQARTILHRASKHLRDPYSAALRIADVFHYRPTTVAPCA